MAGQRADRCIVRSMLMREALRRGGVPSEKIEIVADATAAVGVPAPTRDAALANELGLVDTRVFGYVGGLHAIQEPERLVNILDALKDSHRDLRLLLVGPGRRADAVRERATELRLSGRVVIVDNPPVTQTARFQSLIDVAVFAKSASLAASLAAPQEILEAMAHGRAIVASRTYDAVELIQDRSNGLLGESHDIVGLAALVARLLDNDAWRRAIGRSAQSSLAREASHTAVGQKLDRIFRAVL